MNPIEDLKAAVRVCFAKYGQFDGRAGRAEFWYFVLFVVATQMAIEIIGLSAESLATVLSAVFLILTIAPMLAVGARRLHDIDRSGWWQLLGMIPPLGIVLAIFWALRGTPGPNRFGPPPPALGTLPDGVEAGPAPQQNPVEGAAEKALHMASPKGSADNPSVGNSSVAP